MYHVTPVFGLPPANAQFVSQRPRLDWNASALDIEPRVLFGNVSGKAGTEMELLAKGSSISVVGNTPGADEGTERFSAERPRFRDSKVPTELPNPILDSALALRGLPQLLCVWTKPSVTLLLKAASSLRVD